MARSPRDVRPKRLKYFYLNGLLYKTKRAEKRNNMLYAWDARDHKLTGFLLSEVKAHGQTAYRVGEVADLLGCAVITIRVGERTGRFPKPQRWYSGAEENGRRFYSMDHVRQIRDAMAETHIGRPRDDGMIVVKATLPSAEELEARMRGDEILYIKDGDEFVPLWKAKF